MVRTSHKDLLPSGVHNLTAVSIPLVASHGMFGCPCSSARVKATLCAHTEAKRLRKGECGKHMHTLATTKPTTGATWANAQRVLHPFDACPALSYLVRITTGITINSVFEFVYSHMQRTSLFYLFINNKFEPKNNFRYMSQVLHDIHLL